MSVALSSKSGAMGWVSRFSDSYVAVLCNYCDPYYHRCFMCAYECIFVSGLVALNGRCILWAVGEPCRLATSASWMLTSFLGWLVLLVVPGRRNVSGIAHVYQLRLVIRWLRVHLKSVVTRRRSDRGSDIRMAVRSIHDDCHKK